MIFLSVGFKNSGRRRRRRSIENDIIDGLNRGSRNSIGELNNRNNRNQDEKLLILKSLELFLQSKMNTNDRNYQRIGQPKH